jgi:predicted Zn finger-like uncharacterized protein
MPIQTNCPQCDASYNLADDQDGKKVRCKKCQTIFNVGGAKPRRAERSTAPQAERPMRSGAAKTVPAPRRRRDRDEEEDDYEEERRPRRRGKEPVKSGPPMALILGGSAAAAVLLVGGVIGLIVWSRSGKEDKENKDQVASTQPADTGKSPSGTAPTTNPSTTNTPVTNLPLGNPPSSNSPAQPDPIALQPKIETPIERDSSPTVSSTAPAGNGALTQEVRDRVKRSTVFIHVTSNDGSQASGSGFFGIEKELVLTNAHVVDMLSPESRPPKKIEVTVFKATPEEFKLDGSVIGVDRNSDLAVLSVKSQKATKTAFPPPLAVKSAKTLVETQRLFVSGFPLGEEIGKEISIRPSEVTSFRKNKEGRLDKIQVEGGMTHGNSGGPVVDSAGDVVGVAVSGYDGLNINFAIPGDNVAGFVSGRFDDYTWGQAYNKGKDVIVPVTISMLDPLNRVKDLALEVWVGNDGKTDADRIRQGTIGAPPPSLPGDSARIKGNLDYQKGEGKGEVVFPPIQAGKEWWVQPSWTNSKGNRVYATATVYKPLSPPVDRRSALLAFRPKGGNRRLELRSTSSLGLKEKGSKHSLKIISEANLQETVAVDPGRGTAIRLTYDKFNLGMTLDDQPPPDNSPFKTMFDTVNAYMKQISSNVFQNARGEILTDGAMTFPNGLPVPLQQQLSSTHQEMLHTLESLTIPLPNEKMEYGKSWVEWRILQIDVGKFSEEARVKMTYTYLGVCKRNGRDEAVVRLEGQVKGPDGADDRSAGVWEGTANVSLSTGTVVLANAKVSFDVTGITKGGEQVKLAGRTEMHLKRP